MIKLRLVPLARAFLFYFSEAGVKCIVAAVRRLPVLQLSADYIFEFICDHRAHSVYIKHRFSRCFRQGVVVVVVVVVGGERGGGVYSLANDLAAY